MIRPLSHEMKDFPDRSRTSLQHCGHMRRGQIAGAPDSGAATRPRAPSPRVRFCPTCGASQCAMRSFSSLLPSWSRSVWWPAFVRHASHLLHFEHAVPAISAGTLGTTSSAPSYNTAVFLALCGAHSVGVSSPAGGTRVPFYLVGDVVAY